MVIKEVCAYMLAGSWLPALINGDITGLEPAEVDQLAAFERSIETAHGSGHWSPGTNCEFARDAISGLMAECYTSDYVVLTRST